MTKKLIWVVLLAGLISTVNSLLPSDFIKPEIYDGSVHKKCMGVSPPSDRNYTYCMVNMTTGESTNCTTKSLRGGYKTGDELIKVDGDNYWYCLNKISVCNPTTKNYTVETKKHLDYGYLLNSSLNTPKSMILWEKESTSEYLVPFQYLKTWNSGECKSLWISSIKSNQSDTLDWFINFSGIFLDPLWHPPQEGLNLSVYYAPVNSTEPVHDDSGSNRDGIKLGGRANFTNSSATVNGSSGGFISVGMGVSSSFNTTNDATLQPLFTNSTTWTVGIVYNTTMSSSNILITHGGNGPGAGGALRLAGAGQGIQTCTFGPSFQCTGNVITHSCNNGRYCLAIAEHNFADNRIRTWLNGQLDGNNSMSTNTESTANVTYTFDWDSAADPELNGTIKEIRIYRSSLTQSQILAWWNGLGNQPSLANLTFNDTEFLPSEDIGFNFTYSHPDSLLWNGHVDPTRGNISINWSVNGREVNFTRIQMTLPNSTLNISLLASTGNYTNEDNVTVNITALDQRLNNASGFSIQARTTIPVAVNTRPVNQITNPSTGLSTLYRFRPVNLTFNSSDSQNSSLLVRIFVNGTLNTSFTYTNNTNTTTVLNLSRGTWEICLNVSDGNLSDQDCIIHRLNNTLPNIIFSSPINGTSILWTRQPFNWSFNATDLDGDNLTLNIRLERNDTLIEEILAYNISTNFTRNISLASGAYQLCTNATDGVPGGEDSNESCVFFNLNNTRPNPTLVLPTNNTNVLFSNRPYRFEFNITDQENSTIILRLMVNGSVNATNSSYSPGTNFSFTLNFSRGSYTLRANGSDGDLDNASGEFFFNVNNSPPVFTQAMADHSMFIGEGFVRQVNCTDADSDTIIFGNNHTNLFNISSTGLINYTALTGQNATYNVNITCRDGNPFMNENTSSPFVLTVSNTFSALNDSANFTALETTNQTFRINVTFSVTLLNLTGNFRFNNTIYSLFRDASINVSSTENTTTFRANVIVPLIQVNNTAVSYTYNITKTWSNGTNDTETTNRTMNLTFAYVITGIASDPANVSQGLNTTEGSQDIRINFTMRKDVDFDGVDFSLAFTEFNRTNFSTILHQLRNTSANYTSLVDVPLVLTLNEILTVSPFVHLKYNGTTAIRDFGTSFNITVSQIAITNCSDSGVTQVRSVNVTIRPEDNTSAILLPATWLSQITGYMIPGLNRSFTVPSRSNGSFQVCYRPQFANVTTDWDAEYSNSSYTTRFFFDKARVINNRTQDLTLFLLLNATANKNNVRITVNDENDEPLEGRTVEVYKFSFDTGNATFLTSMDTNFNGEAPFDLQTADTFYKFIVKNGQTKEFETNPFIILSPFTLVFRISLRQDKTTDNILSLMQIPRTLAFNNVTKNITFNFTDNKNIIDRVCMLVNNGTISNLTVFSQCIQGSNGTISFSIGENRSDFEAVIYATTKGSTPAQTYIIERLSVRNTGRTTPLLEGLMATFFVVGVLGFAGLFNPAAAVIFAAFGLFAMAFVEVSFFTMASSISILVVAFVLAYTMKT